MAETAKLLEDAGRGGDLAAAARLVDQLEAEFRQTRAELSALLLRNYPEIRAPQALAGPTETGCVPHRPVRGAARNLEPDAPEKATLC